MSNHPSKLNAIWHQGKDFLAGVVIGLCCVTPALAAPFSMTLPGSLASLSNRDLLLYGSLLLLAVALVGKLIERRRVDVVGAAPPPDAPDLRWWRNPEFQ